MYPFVSVVIPTRNEEKFVGETTESILEQGYTGEYEIILADGRSTDKTVEIIKEYIEKYPNKVRLYDNPGMNSSTGRQVGIDHAKGDYILIFLCHSLMPKNYISTLVDYMKKYPDIDCVGTDYIGFGYENNLFRKAVDKVTSSFLAGAGLLSNRRGKIDKEKFVTSTAFCLYTKDVIKEIKFDPNFVFGQEFEFNYRLKKLGKRMLYTPKVKAYKYDRWSETPSKLFKTFFMAGYARMLITKKHPSSFRIIHTIPTSFIFFITIMPLLSLLNSNFLIIYVVGLLSYIATVLSFSLKFTIDEKNLKYLLLCPIIYLGIHVSFGLGYIFGIFKNRFLGRAHDTGTIVK